MDFQTNQEQARQATTRLIALLLLGVLAIILVVSVLLVALFYYSSGEFQPVSAFAVSAPITTLVIVGASLVKSAQIRGGGGSYVAASMGGRPVDFNTQDLREKQLANVVEEIAIASGMPVPAVFVLDHEAAINAFAAGWTANNSAIGVTRGALVHLSRRELQGVIAHEFSHIRNGDTRVKTRIIGWVFGIAVITIVGRLLLQNLWWAPRRRSSKEGNSTMVLVAAAVGLLIIGWVGTIFARMIQAAVSRQREYLADASAVQYTRDPSGIGEALMKIGGVGSNKIQAAHATEASHLFFTSAFKSGFASHPPLKDRITRLLPDWDGNFTGPTPEAMAELAATTGAQTGSGRQSAGGRPAAGQGRGATRPSQGPLPGMPGLPGLPGLGGAGTMLGLGLPAQGATPGVPASGFAAEPGLAPESGSSDGSAALPADWAPAPDARQRFQAPSMDGPSDAHVDYARLLLAQIPEPVQNYLHTKQGAVAAVIGLLVSNDPLLRPHQLDFAARSVALDPHELDAASKVISDLDRRLQLPAVDMALHSIRETSPGYRHSLAQAIEAIESSRPDQDLFRWMLRRVLLRHLADQHDDGSARHELTLGQVADQAVAIYAVLSWFNSAGAEQAPSAFASALAAVGLPSRELPPLATLTFEQIDDALEDLSHLSRAERPRFVAGATAVVLDDGTATAEEAELIRVVADAVGHPVPPLLPV